MDVEANGIRIEYTIEGDGPPFVLLHGFTLDRTLWEPQVRALRRGYRVIAPDLRGHGGTSLGSVSASGMDLMADDVHALLDRIAVHEPVVLGGLSMGGFVAFAFLRKYRQRVRALILADTRATADADDRRRSRLALAERAEREGSAQPIYEDLFPKLLAPASYGRQALVAQVRAMVERSGPAGLAAALRGMTQRPDSTPLLAEVGCPTLIVVGEHDALTPPSDARAMHAAIAGSELLEVPGTGHLANLEAPDEINPAIIRFLERSVARG